MSKTFAKPYISSFGVTLYDFKLKQPTRMNEVGLMPARVNVGLTLYLGEKNIGTQQYVFHSNETPPTNSHKGLPNYKAIVDPTGAAATAWLKAIDSILDSKLPEFSDESIDSQKSGPALYLRVNRIEANMDWDKPAERYIAVFVSAYEDDKFTRQVEDATISVLFAEDAYIVQQARNAGIQGELNAETISAFRAENRIFSMPEFLAKQGVVAGIGTMGASFFTVLTKCVYNWVNADVATIMAQFVLPVEVPVETGGIKPEPPATPAE